MDSRMANGEVEGRTRNGQTVRRRGGLETGKR